MCGDVKTNPGLPATNNEQDLRTGSLNAFSVVNKTEPVLKIIDKQHLDVLAVTETCIKDNHPPAIKHDIALPGYSVHHAHRQSNGKGDGITLFV